MSRTAAADTYQFQRIAFILSGETDGSLVNEATKQILSQIHSLLRTCKFLSSNRKEQQVGRCFQQTTPLLTTSRELATKLAQLYISHFESAFRILHIPTFWAEFDKYWADAGEVSTPLSLKVHLVLIIGSSVCLDSAVDKSTLPRSLIGLWVQFAHVWASGPTDKDRLSIDGLQIQCLLVLTRQVLAIGADLVYLTMGQVIHMAIQMGLHRDPRHFHKMNTL